MKSFFSGWGSQLSETSIVYSVYSRALMSTSSVSPAGLKDRKGIHKKPSEVERKTGYLPVQEDGGDDPGAELGGGLLLDDGRPVISAGEGDLGGDVHSVLGDVEAVVISHDVEMLVRFSES